MFFDLCAMSLFELIRNENEITPTSRRTDLDRAKIA